MLYVSLAISLFSAFLAMLGKQWLNKYASTDMQGTAIERSQNRQSKHNGIVIWHFHHLMELLPLMLQVALLLLDCALTLYIWGINTTVASVVLSFIVFGATCYVFIIVAAMVSVHCPYKTPVALVLLYLWQMILGAFTVQHPEAQPDPEQPPGQQATVLDFLCISWILQTSLNKGIKWLSLKFLASILTSPAFKISIVEDLFKVLTSSISVTKDNQVTVLQGSEELAETAAACLLGTISHSLIVDSKSNVLKDVHQQYARVFQPGVNLEGLPFHHTISGVHNLFNRNDYPKGLSWEGIDPSTLENLSLANNLAKVAWLCSRGQILEPEGQGEVPDWILHFSSHCLLWNPKPPASVTTSCLLIIAIELGCDVPEILIRNLDKRCVYTHTDGLTMWSVILTLY